MKNCRRARRWILLAVDQELSLEERLRLEEHLEHCAACGALHGRALRLEQALVELPEPPREPLDVETALAAVRARVSGAHPTVNPSTVPVDAAPVDAKQPRWQRPVVWAAAAALLLVPPLAVLLRDAAPEDPLDAPLQLVRSEGVGGEGVPIDGRSSVDATAAGELQPSVEPVTEAEPLSVVFEPPVPDSREAVAAELRGWIRAHLGPVSQTQVGVDALDFVGLERRLGRWPLARMAEDLLTDRDLPTAHAAARYLGLRGDRISVVRLQAHLSREELAPVVVRALGDLGAMAVGALRSVLENEQEDQTLRLAALGALAQAGGAQAAKTIEASLLASLRGDPSGLDAEWVEAQWEALARCGAPAVGSLLRLAQAQGPARRCALDQLAKVDGAAPELLGFLDRPLALGVESGAETLLLLEAVGRLTPGEALPWVAERAAEHRHRALALRTLGAWPGAAPLAMLLEMDEAGRLPRADLVDTLRHLAERDGARLAEMARGLVQADDALALERYLELLVASEHRRAAGALVEMVLADCLSDDGRQWAALAVGELGSARHGERLAQALATLEIDHRRLFAAALISVQRLLGQDGVRHALQALSRSAQRAVLASLPDDSSGGASVPCSTDQGAVALFRVARALGDARRVRRPDFLE